MEPRSTLRGDVVFAGLGGMGVLVAGRILALGALNRYKHVSWFPSYGVEKRGGLCECTVVFSDHEIPSPILDQSQTVVVLTGSQLKNFEPRVLPGGMMLVDSAGLDEEERKRKDYKLLKVPGMEFAISTGNLQINNIILLGAYIGLTDKVPAEFVEEAIRKMLGTEEQVRKQNLQAFMRGIELGATQKSDLIVV
jgi:2-oxoglutarate ferredoxin oxidoreductase subunit gamma